jgi:hypothetical protein
MFEHISRACGEQLTHAEHATYEGFLWHRKVTCYGKRHDGSADAHVKTVNQMRKEAGLPELEVHKHQLYFSGLGWGGKIDAPRPLDHNKHMIFHCTHDCPVSFEVRIPKWRYREMTLSMPKVDQTWPG